MPAMSGNRSGAAKAPAIRTALEVKVLPLASLKPAPYNPRAVSPEALAGLRRSLELYGYVEPIIRNKRTGNVVGGHQHLRAMIEAGVKEAPVIEVDLGEKAERQLNVTLNNKEIAGDFTADLAGMIEEFRLDLPEADFAELRFDDLLKNADLGEEPEIEEDVAPEPPAKAISKTGDLWEIGPHRILCGDSTKAKDVGRVMGGQKASLMNTDPPYGVDYGDVANSRERAANKRKGGDGKIKRDQHIRNDDLTGADLQSFLEACIRTAVPHLIPNPAFYLWHPMLTQGTFFAAAAAAADILIHRQVIWVKPSLILGRGDYHWRHELCFYGWVRGKRCRWLRGRDQNTVWEIGRQNDNVHPTQKPLALFEVPILNHLRPGEIAYEPFSGSGSQLVAAQQLGRRCFAIEIEPRYVDVSVLRLMRAAPKLPVKCSRPEAAKAMKERVDEQAKAAR